MWSKFKPPITNRLLIKFLKYKKINIASYNLHPDLLFLKVNELTKHIVLCKNFRLSFFNFSKTNNFFLNYSLIFFPIKNNQMSNFFNFSILLETILKSFNLKTNLESKFQSLFLNKSFLSFKPIFLKNYLFNNNSIFYNPKFKIFPNENLFFFNSFYSLFLKKILVHKSKQKFIQKKITIFYNFDFFVFSFTQNRFEWKYFKINKYLKIQKGFFKNTSFFINRHYLLSTSTQNYNLYKYNLLQVFFSDNFAINFLKKSEIKQKKNMILDGIYIWNRNLTILPYYINKIFYIYTGRWFTRIRILPAMINWKFGEFAFTWKVHTWKLWLNFKNLE